MNPALQPIQSSRAWRWLGSGILLVLTLAAFGRVLGNQFVEWDDHSSIYQNSFFVPPRMSALPQFWTAANQQFYVPMTYTVLWALAHLGIRTLPDGTYTLSPLPFHAASLTSHAISVVILFRLLARLTKNEKAAWFAAALFAAHPLHVESVAWASTLYTPLSGMLSLAAMAVYFRFSDLRSQRETDPRGKSSGSIWLVGFYVFFIIALLTKPTIILLPVIIAVIEIGLRGRPIVQIVKLMLPPLLIGCVPIAIATQLAQPPGEIDLTVIFRPLIATDVLAFYMGKMVLPIHLAPDYGHSPQWLLNEGSTVLFSTWIVPFVVFSAALLAWRRTHWPLVASAVFVLALAPVLGLTTFDFQRYSTVADRYTYFALIAPAMLVAKGLATWQKKWAYVCTGLLAVVFGIASIVQASHWHDTPSFYAFAMSRNPDSFAAHTYYIRVLDREGRINDAIDHYRAANRAYPYSPRLQYQMAQVCLSRGLWDEAIDAFTRAATLSPNDSRVLGGLGIALAQTGRRDEAAAVVHQATAVNPNDPAAHLNAGVVFATVGRTEEARAEFQTVIQLNGDVAAARQGLEMLDRIKSQKNEK